MVSLFVSVLLLLLFVVVLAALCSLMWLTENCGKKSDTPMTASVLKQDPNTKTVKRNFILIYMCVKICHFFNAIHYLSAPDIKSLILYQLNL